LFKKPGQITGLVYNFYMLYVLLILGVIFLKAYNKMDKVDWGLIAKSFLITLSSLSISISLSLVVSVFVAYEIIYYYKYVQGALILLSTITAAIPPVIIGIALLVLFKSVAFTFPALIVVQFTVATPFIIRGIVITFSMLDYDMLEAAMCDGADGFKLLWYIVLPVGWKGVVTSLLTGAARALSEVGATALFGGLIEGKTLTLACAVFYYTTEGNLDEAFVAAFITCLAALMLFGSAQILERLGKKEGGF